MAKTHCIMAQLKDVLAKPGVRPQVILDCEKLIESEVKSKGGLSGIAIKGGFAMVKAIKPGVIAESVDHLLDGFIDRLEPFYAKFQASGATGKFGAQLTSDKSAVAEALLGFTDDKAKNAKNTTMKKAYEKLRPTAKEHVQAAVPGLGQVIEKYLV